MLLIVGDGLNQEDCDRGERQHEQDQEDLDGVDDTAKES